MTNLLVAGLIADDFWGSILVSMVMGLLITLLFSPFWLMPFIVLAACFGGMMLNGYAETHRETWTHGVPFPKLPKLTWDV